MNYKKKIQEIELEINMINKYYINQIKEPDDKITKRLNILREEHYFLLEKYYKKSQDIILAIVTFFQAVFIFCILITIIKFIIKN
jgi:hypothetical protein